MHDTVQTMFLFTAQQQLLPLPWHDPSTDNSSISPVDSTQGVHHGGAVLESVGGANVAAHVGLLSLRARVADGEGAPDQPVAGHVAKLLVVVGVLAAGAAAGALGLDLIRSLRSGNEDSLLGQAGDATSVGVEGTHLVRQFTFR